MHIKLQLSLIYYKAKFALEDEIALGGLLDLILEDSKTTPLTEEDIVSLYIDLIGIIPKHKFFLLGMESREDVKKARILLESFNDDDGSDSEFDPES